MTTLAPPIVFVDCETTGLGPLSRPWEIALIRREPDGAERTLLLHVVYPLGGLPEGTEPYALHLSGWLVRGVEGSEWTPGFDGDELFHRVDEQEAATELNQWLRGDPVLVGVGVHFDARMLSGLLGRAGRDPEPWHYALVDLKAATWGNVAAHVAGDAHHLAHLVDLPLSSEQLAAAAGVIAPGADERHTALGDARWAVRWFDALAGLQ